MVGPRQTGAPGIGGPDIGVGGPANCGGSGGAGGPENCGADAILCWCANARWRISSIMASDREPPNPGGGLAIGGIAGIVGGPPIPGMRGGPAMPGGMEPS
jgi:hypothetical protein